MTEQACDSPVHIGTEADPDAPDPEPGLVIDVMRHAGRWCEREAIELRLAALARVLSARIPDLAPGCVVALALSDDDAVRALNRDFRGQDKPTNVLSFPAAREPSRPADDPAILGLDALEPACLGDVIVAEETVLREAMEQAIPASDHLVHLTAHGILHLVGYDHETEHEAEIMETVETDILAELGISNPYTRSQGDPPGITR